MSEEKNNPSKRRRKRRERNNKQEQGSGKSRQPRRNDSQEEQDSSNSNRRRRRRRRSRKGGSGGEGGQGSNSNNSNGSNNSNSSNNSGSRNNSNRRRNNNNNNNSKNGRRRSSNSNRSNRSNNGRSNNHQGANTPASKFGGRDPVNPDAGQDRDGDSPELTAFELFCAYHLGITEDNGYRKPRARDIAKRFDISINEMHDAMQRLQIDKNSFERYNFDLSLAQLDIRVAPEGVDRREIAKVHYNELCELNPGLDQQVE
ncbi:MAG: hypothetical protein VYE40_00420 [Myxococcota bacterium]|nr:hypothetical protein [Myxococcota bacterium]